MHLVSGHSTRTGRGCLPAAVGIAHLVLLVAGAPADAQIVLDGTVGPSGPLKGPDFAIGADLGRQLGPNLFHSFREFNLANGESATFTGPDAIENVIGRVTGGHGSMIDGRVASDIPGANLYLINPAGVVFGPNATLDVQGSFQVGTADSVRLADGGHFDATAPERSVLTIAAPSAFGFLGAAPAAIEVRGSDLGVADGANLSVVGGDIDVRGASLAAPGGRILLASASRPGEVPLEPGPEGFALDPDIGRHGGSIRLSEGSSVAVSGEGAGTVVVRAGRLEMLEGSQVVAATEGSEDGGEIDVGVGDLTLRDGAQVVTATSGTGDGARLRVRATGSVTMVGRTEEGDRSGLVSLSDSTEPGAGDAGSISVQAGRVMLDEANIESTTEGDGAGGAIDIEVDDLTMENGAVLGSATHGSGDAGSVSVRADAIYLAGRDDEDNRTSILSETGVSADDEDGESKVAPSSPGRAGDPRPGRGGAIHLQAQRIEVDDGTVTAESLRLGGGDAGSVSVEAEQLVLVGGGEISASTESTGDAGAVSVHADTIEISGINSEGDKSVIASDSNLAEPEAGSGGTVHVVANVLTLDDGAIATDTLGGGRGGEIAIEVSELVVHGGSEIAATASGTGDAGGITIHAEDSITISGADDSGNPSRLSSLSERKDMEAGRAGAIEVTTAKLDMRGGEISVTSLGEGAAGDVRVIADEVYLRDGAVIAAESASTTQQGGSLDLEASSLFLSEASSVTTRAAQANGGNIEISSRDVRLGESSTVSASVAGGGGNGGNVTISADGGTIVLIGDSTVTANAVGGSGGNVTIAADAFLRCPGCTVSASSELSEQGTVSISGVESNLVGALSALPVDYLDVEEVAARRCAVRVGESSFTVRGVEGVPPAPGEDP